MCEMEKRHARMWTDNAGTGGATDARQCLAGRHPKGK